MDEVKKYDEILPQTRRFSDKQPQIRDKKFVHFHPQDHTIGDHVEGVKTRSLFKDLASYALVSKIESKTIDEALIDDGLIIAMEEELYHLTRNNVWVVVLKPNNKSIIGTRLVFKKKFDEQGKMVETRIG